MMQNKAEPDPREWTNLIPVRFEWVKCALYREFAFLKPANVRALRLYKIDQVPDLLKLVRYDRFKPNMYVSVAKLRHVPPFTYHPKKRASETLPWFQEQYAKEVFEYDLFLDVDKEPDAPWDDLLLEVKNFKEWLDEYKVPYTLVFSGAKGFHLTIPYKYLPKNLTFAVDEVGHGLDGSVFAWTKKWQEQAKEVFGLKHLDLANNGVFSRLQKLPYSLVGDQVVLPLSDEQFKNWKVEHMHKDYILKHTIIKNRGMLLRTHGMTDEELCENVKNFTKEFKLA